MYTYVPLLARQCLAVALSPCFREACALCLLLDRRLLSAQHLSIGGRRGVPCVGVSPL